MRRNFGKARYAIMMLRRREGRKSIHKTIQTNEKALDCINRALYSAFKASFFVYWLKMLGKKIT